MKVPTIFISSTFYDLKHIRADLCSFIENDLNYKYLASEFPSFPINPSNTIVENCTKCVQDEVDIFILIIGGRYGSIDKTLSKSITNIEYLAAKSKNIPIYVFISKDILAILPLWESSPSADFSNVVDTIKLFDFITNVRSEDAAWCFPFETSQDIIKTLKIQFAYLMHNNLMFYSKLSGKEQFLDQLSGKSLQIIFEKPKVWEGKLFAQSVSDEIDKMTDLRLAYNYNISFGCGQIIADSQFIAWIRSIMDEALRLIDGIKIIIKKSLNTALNTSDIRKITYASREIGNAYRYALDWVSNIRCAHMNDKYRPLTNAVSLMLDDLINELGTIGFKISEQIDNFILNKQEENDSFVYNIAIEVSNMNNINTEVERLKMNDIFQV